MRCLLLFLFVLCTPTAMAAEPPKVGLALSGGGTKGGAHIGVLKLLEEQNIKVSYIAGTSVGAIIGAMYAVGMSAAEIEHAIAEIDWDDVLTDDPPRPTVPIEMKRGDFDYLVRSRPGLAGGEIKLPLGITQGQKITRLLRQLLQRGSGIEDFDDLAIPFRAVATSLETGAPVVLSRGDLPVSVRASMSLPGLFSPVEIDGQFLVDGGVAANLPMDVVRAMGADHVIAVDITSPLLPRGEIRSLLGVTEQLINIMTRRNADEQISARRAGDVVIAPDVSVIDTLDFQRTLDAVEPGYMAASAHLAALKLLGSPTRTVKVPQPQSPPTPIVAFVEVEDNSGLAANAALARLDLAVGKPFDRKALDRSISRLYGSGLYQRIDYNLVQRGGETGVSIRAEAKSWGPDYLQFGLQLEEDFSSDANFNVGVAYVKTGINGLGGQTRFQLDLGARQGISGEWFQPWTYDGRLFSRFRLGYERNNLRFYDDAGKALADLRIQEVGTTLSLGRQVGRASEVELAWQRLHGQVNELVGQFDIPEDRFDVSEIALSYRLDTLNRTNRPTSGSLIRVTGLGSSRHTGGSDDYEQAHALATKAWRMGQAQLEVTGIAGSTIDSNAPLQSQFVLGGLGRLSGHPIDRFFGQHVALLRANLSIEPHRFPVPVFAGFSLETGNTWDTDFNDGPEDWITAGSVYAGINTFVGPVYFAVGAAEGGTQSVYLSLGNPFAAQAIRPFD